MMNEFFKKVAEHILQKKPFVLYRKPNSNTVIGMFQLNDDLYDVNNFTEKGFVFASFDGNKIFLIPEYQSEKIEFVWENEAFDSIDNVENVLNTADKEYFENLVAKGIQTIENGIFQKVVLSRKEIIELDDFDLIFTFQKMIQSYPTAFVYCFQHPKVGVWLGATPEQLLKVEDNVIKTMALAGTRKNTGNEYVEWEDKEKIEQQFVTDYIVSELCKITESITISEPCSVRAGNIWHIKTDISGTIGNDQNLKEVVELLHPTPAVCGLPKKESRKFIIENENYDRSFYTGFLGELNLDTKTDLFVNLRSMEIVIEQLSQKTKANLFIGCGITKDSIPEKEWEESVNKSITMKKVLG